MSERILGVLASGGGSNFKAIDDAIRDGRLPNASIGVLLSDNPSAGALNIANERDIPNFVLPRRAADGRDEMIRDVFRDHGVELGIGAGYTSKVGRSVLDVYPDTILNIHPAPLPRFGGKGMHGIHVHEAVIAAGVKWSGPTVHLMNENYDEGQILAHVQVPVLEGDLPEDLAARVLIEEHKLFYKVIDQQLQRGLPAIS